MKVYKGLRTPDGSVVTVDNTLLDPRVDLKRESDGNFEWGYDGAGPRQLALAILADHLTDDRLALSLHVGFAESVVAELMSDEWTLTDDNVQSSLDQVAIVPMDLKTLLDRARGIRIE